MKRLIHIAVFIILLLLVVFGGSMYAYHNQSIFIESSRDIQEVIIFNNMTGAVYTINNSNEYIIDFIYLLDKIEEETHVNPSELDWQESEPLYSIELHYDSGNVGVINSNESGNFYYRMIEGTTSGGWVGGESESLYRKLNSIF